MPSSSIEALSSSWHSEQSADGSQSKGRVSSGEVSSFSAARPGRCGMEFLVVVSGRLGMASELVVSESSGKPFFSDIRDFFLCLIFSL